MYNTVVDSTPLIKVTSAKHEANYSVNGSLMNPLEAFYAALAACAAVLPAGWAAANYRLAAR